MILTYVHAFGVDGNAPPAFFRAAVRYDLSNPATVKILSIGNEWDRELLLFAVANFSQEYQGWVDFVIGDLFPRLTQDQAIAGEKKLWEMQGWSDSELNSK